MKKDKPIIFNTEMVKAILDDRKTQTRRIIKLQPPNHVGTCPYSIGKKLWVRETWNDDWCDNVIYRADGGSAITAGYKKEPKWKPSIFMPKNYARIWLEVTAIGIERLQDITEQDAMEEGDPNQGLIASENTHVEWFNQLWDSINKKRGYGWGKNPWVWVIKFKKIKTGDELC